MGLCPVTWDGSYRMGLRLCPTLVPVLTHVALCRVAPVGCWRPSKVVCCRSSCLEGRVEPTVLCKSAGSPAAAAEYPAQTSGEVCVFLNISRLLEVKMGEVTAVSPVDLPAFISGNREGWWTLYPVISSCWKR